MKANAPEKLYFGESDKGILDIYSNRDSNDEVEYTRTDAFIEKAITWLKENITNDHTASKVISRKGCVTMGMLIEDFKQAMKNE